MSKKAPVIEIQGRAKESLPPPVKRPAKWWVAAGMILVLAAVGYGWFRARQAPPPALVTQTRPVETSGSGLTGAVAVAKAGSAKLPVMVTGLVASVASPPVQSERSRAPLVPGSIRIRAETADYAAACLAQAEKRLRVGTNVWTTIQSLPMTIQGLPTGSTPVWLSAKNFECEQPSGTNLVAAFVASGATTDVIFVLAPNAAQVEVHASAPGGGEPRRVRARHILVQVKTGENGEGVKTARRAQAEKWRKELLAGADFAALAREHSDCPSKKAGGDLGFFARGVMVKPFEDIAFRLVPGQISDVVETDFGFHVIQVIEREGVGRPLSLAETSVYCLAPNGPPLKGNPLKVPSLRPLTLTVSAAGCRPQSLKLDPLAPDTVKRCEVSLEAEVGAVRVTATTPDFAREYFSKTAKRFRMGENDWQPVTALPYVVSNLAVGSVEVTLDADGFGPATQRVTVADAQTTEATFALTPRSATLTLSCNVTQALAQVSSLKSQVSSPLSVPSLQALTLTVSATGYVAQVVKVDPLNPGQEQRLAIKLEPVSVSSPMRVSTSGAGKPMTVDLGGGVKLELVWVPPGSFEMGGNEYNEKPPHQVRISKGFWMGKFEVTQAQWQQVMGSNPSQFKGESLPVETVSWKECQEFLKKVKSGVKSQESEVGEFRLPTEAEWEYACRAGTSTKFNTGNEDSDLDRAGWYEGNIGSATHSVGQKVANAWGLHDMHGNVWEWCQDWLGNYDSNMTIDPTGPSSGSYRVLRGGSWNANSIECRSSNRSYYDRTNAYGSLGFRVVVWR